MFQKIYHCNFKFWDLLLLHTCGALRFVPPSSKVRCLSREEPPENSFAWLWWIDHGQQIGPNPATCSLPVSGMQEKELEGQKEENSGTEITRV